MAYKIYGLISLLKSNTYGRTLPTSDVSKGRQKLNRTPKPYTLNRIS